MTLTGRLYVDNLMLKCSIEYPDLKLDPGAALQYINDGRRSVYNEIMGLKEWAFMNQKSAVSNPFTFATTDKMIKVVNVWATGAPAAEMDTEESYSVGINTIVQGTTSNPKYVVEGLTVTLSPASISSININYLTAPVDLAFGDTEDFIPIEFQEAVVMRALQTAYEKLADSEAVDAVMQDNTTYVEAYKKTFYDTLTAERREYEASPKR